MSLSKEYQEYHLTPNGWVEGFFKADTFGADIDGETPLDYVLIVRCYDEWVLGKRKPIFYDEIIWKTKDTEALNKLKKKYGAKPDWGGYKMGA